MLAVLRPRGWTVGHGLEQVLLAQKELGQTPKPITLPPTDVSLYSRNLETE